MIFLDELIRTLSRIPGLGPKSAARIVMHLLKADPAYVEGLARQIRELKTRVRYCRSCGNFADGEECEICLDPSRDRTQICVIEQPQDVQSIEATKEYRGLYHVLSGVLSPIDGIGPDELRIPYLSERIRKDGVKEVILATNATVEGDTTALYIQRLLKNAPVKVTRLASGIPAGGDLEYADRLTLTRSIRGRVELEP